MPLLAQVFKKIVVTCLALGAGAMPVVEEAPELTQDLDAFLCAPYLEYSARQLQIGAVNWLGH